MYALTQKSIKKLNKALGLPATGSEEHWDTELADHTRVEEFVVLYEKEDLDNDDRTALMALILASMQFGPLANNADIHEKLAGIIRGDASILEPVLSYWSTGRNSAASGFVREAMRVPFDGELAEEIKKAFSNTVYPGDENIVRKEGYDDEVAECEAKFQGKTWQEVDWLSIKDEGYASGCAFLTREAYRYYLPAYLIAILEHREEMSEAFDAVVLSLTLPAAADYTVLKESLVEHPSTHSFLERQAEIVDGTAKNFRIKAEEFTLEQKRVIRRFLAWLAKSFPEYFPSNEPLVALERYWNEF